MRIPRGAIVVAEVPDPQKQNPKKRPLVLVDDVEDGDAVFRFVGITSSLPPELTADHIVLPWNADARRTKTKLTAPCAALCSWFDVAPLHVIDKQLGRVSDEDLYRILERLESLFPDMFGDD